MFLFHPKLIRDHPYIKNLIGKFECGHKLMVNQSTSVQCQLKKSEKRRCTVCLANPDNHQMRKIIVKCICIECSTKYMKLQCLTSDNFTLKSTNPDHIPTGTPNSSLSETIHPAYILSLYNNVL